MNIKKYREIAEAAQSDLAAGKTIWTDNMINYYHMTRPEAVLRLLDKIEELNKHLALALSFAPKGPVPEGLAPMFYHTLEYNSEVELQKRIDTAREALRADAEENKP